MELRKITDEIFVIDNFWTKEQCEAFIAKSEAIGYEAATIITERGPRLVESVRNNNRVLYKDYELAENIWQDMKPFAPVLLGKSIAIGLNELFRFYRYEPGQQFRKHIDQPYIRNEKEASYYTFMIYLNDDYEGGATTFHKININPSQGMALIFLHKLEHAGSEVTKGIKYVLRTDIMYRLTI